MGPIRKVYGTVLDEERVVPNLQHQVPWIHSSFLSLYIFCTTQLFLLSKPSSNSTVFIPFHLTPFYIICLICLMNPYFSISLFLYFSPPLALCSFCICQSLCEFYANHCARIEALRRQLEDEQRVRQVVHTTTAGPELYCSLRESNQYQSYCIKEHCSTKSI